MTPKAPVPHLTHPHLVHARVPRRRAGRWLEQLAAVCITPVLIFIAALTTLGSMMTAVRPGVNFSRETRKKLRQDNTDTGVAFFVILAERGPINTPIEVNDLAGYVTNFGDRVSYGWGYDAVDVYTREGGTRVVLVRAGGPTPVTAIRTLVDRAGSPLNTLDVKAKSPGDWGDRLTVTVADGDADDTFTLTVKLDGDVVETTQDLASPSEAVAWAAASSDYVTITDRASATAAPANNPAVVANAALTTGTDDHASITETQWAAAIAALSSDLGHGQVAVPGRTTSATWAALAAHADATGRRAFLDQVDTPTVATLDAAADAIRAGDANPENSASFAPWLTCPGITRNTTRTVPPSVVACALAARSDRATGNANAAPVGMHDNGAGVLRFCTGVTQTWTDAERQTLNESGVNVFIYDRPLGQVELYGWRTLVDPDDDPEWVQLNWSRFAMQLEAETIAIGKRFFGAQIDGQRRKISEFHGVVTGNLLRHFESGALFGETPDDAYEVTTDAPVNTVDTIADGQLNVQIAAHMSPFAEQVNIVLVKVPLADPVSV